MATENEVAFANKETFQNMMLFQKRGPKPPKTGYCFQGMLSARGKNLISQEIFVAGSLCLLPL